MDFRLYGETGGAGDAHGVTFTAEKPTPASVIRNRSRSRRWQVLVAAAVALVAAVVVLVTWPGASPAQAEQLTRTRHACQMWTAAEQQQIGPAWCTDMVHWMRQQIQDGAATGGMMWATPAAMLDTCHRWAATQATVDVTRCDDMVAWMRTHVSSGRGWMMRGGGMMGTTTP